MKKLLLLSALAGGLTVGLFAVDFSGYSTDALMNMRGSVPIEQREAFRTEVQKRVLAMTPEERAKYNVGKGVSGSGQGRGMMLKDGTGGGRGQGRGMGN